MKILHLSDLHFGYDNNEVKKAQRANYLKALNDELKRLSVESPADYLLISGDIGWRAHKNDYKEALEWTEKIIKICALEKDHVFICPGNHDADRNVLFDKQFPRDQAEANEFIHSDRFVPLEKAFSNYSAFCDELHLPRYRLGEIKNYLSGVYSNSEINIICLNTAWYAKSDSVQDKMWVGSNFLDIIHADRFDRNNFTLCLCHHPKRSWHEQECLSYPNTKNTFQMACEMSDMMPYGHTHEITGHISYEFDTYISGTGAVYENDIYRNNFQMYEIDANAKKCVKKYEYWFDGKHWGSPVVWKYNSEPVGEETVQKIVIDISSLPIPQYIRYQGRQEIIKELNDHLKNGNKCVICIHGFAGNGKTSLIHRWLTEIASGYGGAAKVFSWHFYSQEDQKISDPSVNLFFEKAISFFSNDTCGVPKTDFNRVEYLVGLLNEQKCILILDGVESLQNPPGIEAGNFKNKTFQHFLTSISRDGLKNGGLVILTSRQKAAELENLDHHFKNIPLPLLGKEHCVSILKGFGLKGTEKDFTETVREYKGHPLALTLFSKIITDIYDGDLSCRNKINVLKDGKESGEIIDNLLNYYCSGWKKDQAEQVIMLLISIFKRPATNEQMRALIDNSKLCKGLRQSGEKELSRTRVYLKKTGLILESDTWDTHALIREYFFNRFQKNNPADFLECNKILFEYFQNEPMPANITRIEDLDPLYRAVYYGCKSNNYKAAYEIFWEKISRKREFFSQRVLGALDNDLFVVSQFFDENWEIKKGIGLSKTKAAWLMSVASFILAVSGRVEEGEKLRRKEIDIHRARKNEMLMLYDRYNLSNNLILQNKLKEARGILESILNVSKNDYRPNDEIEEHIDLDHLFNSCRSRLAYIKYLQGELDAAYGLINGVSQKNLYSLNGYYRFLIYEKSGVAAETLQDIVTKYAKDAESRSKLFELGLAALMQCMVSYKTGDLNGAFSSAKDAYEYMKKSNRIDEILYVISWYIKCCLKQYERTKKTVYKKDAADLYKELLLLSQIYRSYVTPEIQENIYRFGRSLEI